MFGRNEISGPMMHDDGRLFVHKIFDTIQGEGPDAGRPAIFVRLGKCNLRCFFCDTQFETGEFLSLTAAVAHVAEIAKEHRRELVVITGGEPLLQNIVPFVMGVNALGIACSVETAGTMFYEGLRDVFSPTRSIHDNLIVCSPKTPRIADGMESIVGAWKYIIQHKKTADDGLPIASTQIPGRTSHIFRPSIPAVPIFVQAMDELDDAKNLQNLHAAVKSSMDHGHRLCVQIHKLANLD